MPVVIVLEDGSCVFPPGHVRPGPYDLELDRGVLTLHPLVRQAADAVATSPAIEIDGLTVATGPRRASSSGRDYIGRSWTRVPRGTRMTGPAGIGVVTMGSEGQLDNGRTPNKHLTDHGITANAWQVFKLPNGTSVGDAYDANVWP